MSRISSPMSGTRRIGLTTRTGYKSLHGDHLQKTRESNASVFAPPEDSSDDITSEDSEFGRIENSEKPSGYALPRRRSANGEDGKRRELSVEPSNIRAGSFTSSKGPNGSQSSQKRKNTDFDDDLPHSFSQQQKKPRLSYSHGGMNKHNGMRQSGTKPVNRTKVTAAKENIKAGHTFKTPQSNDMLARRKSLLVVGLFKRMQLTLISGPISAGETHEIQKTSQSKECILFAKFAAGSEGFPTLGEEHTRVASKLGEEFQAASKAIPEEGATIQTESRGE